MIMCKSDISRDQSKEKGEREKVWAVREREGAWSWLAVTATVLKALALCDECTLQNHPALLPRRIMNEVITKIITEKK